MKPPFPSQVQNCQDVRSEDGALWATAFCLKAGCPCPTSSDRAAHAGCKRLPVAKRSDVPKRAPDLYCTLHPSCLACEAGDVVAMTEAQFDRLFTFHVVVLDADANRTDWRGDPWTTTLRHLIKPTSLQGKWLIEPPFDNKAPHEVTADDLDKPIDEIGIFEGSMLFFEEAP